MRSTARHWASALALWSSSRRRLRSGWCLPASKGRPELGRPAYPLLLLVWNMSFACAPSQAFRPAGAPGLGREQELGIAVSSVRPRPYVTEPAREVGQAWWGTRLRGPWSFATLLAFDVSALAAGAALRLDTLQTRSLTLAAEVEGGFAWGAVSLPVALRVYDGFGVYCSPRIGNWGAALTPFLPCGVQGELVDGVIVRGELQLSWADFEAYNRRAHWGLALAHQW